MKFNKGQASLFFLATICVLGIAISIEVFVVRRNKMVQDISSLVGEHLIALRASKSVGGPMPVNMLISAMNQVIHPDNEKAAKTAIDNMMGVVTEAKRRSFMLPLVHKDVAVRVKSWAEKGTEVSASAAKLLAHIMERHAQHVDQVVAQSYITISTSDPLLAAQTMRSLTHQIEGALSSGLSIDPKMLLLKPNAKTVEQWISQSENLQAKTAAEMLMKTFEEAKVLFARPD